MKTKKYFWTFYWKWIILFSLFINDLNAQDYYKNYPLNTSIAINGSLNRLEVTVFDSVLQSVVSFNTPWTYDDIIVTGNNNGKATFTYWPTPTVQTDQLSVIVYDMILHQFFLDHFDIGSSQSLPSNIVCGPNWVEMKYEFDGGGWYGYPHIYMRYNLFLHKWVTTNGLSADFIRFANIPSLYNLPQIGNCDRLLDEDDYSFIYYDPIADNWHYFISSNTTNYLEEDNFYGEQWPNIYLGLQTYDPRTHKLERFERENLETELFDGVYVSHDVDSTFKHFFTIYDIGTQQWISDSLFTAGFSMLQSKNRTLAFVSENLGVKYVVSMVYNHVLHSWIKDSVLVSGNITNLQVANGTVTWNDAAGFHTRGYDQTLGWGNFSTSIFMNFELIDFTGLGYPFIYVKNYSIGSDSVYYDFGDGTITSDNRDVFWHHYTKSGNYNVCIFNATGNQSNCQSVSLTMCNYSGVASVLSDTICAGDSAQFTVSGNLGSVQWQRKEGSFWIDIVAPGSNQPVFTYAMDSSLLVRAKIYGTGCVPSYSNEQFIFIHKVIGTPVVSDTIIHKCFNKSFPIMVNGVTQGTQHQWEAGDGITWTPFTSSFPYANINSNENWIRCKLSSGNCFIDTSIVIQQIISTNPVQLPDVLASCCGPGPVILQTTATGTALWYDNSGKILLGVGDSVQTNVTSSILLKVVDSDGLFVKLGYEDNTIGTIATDTLTNIGMRIGVQEPCYLETIKVYPTNSGFANIIIRKSNGQTLFTSSSISVSNNPQGQVLPINFYLNGLQTYDIFISSVNQSVLFQYNTSGITYPLTVPGSNVTILGYVDSIFHSTPDLYQFYDLNIAQGCRSTPATVTVMVGTPLNATIAANGPTVFCRGDSVTVTASPFNASFQYSWLVNGSLIPGANSSSYTITSPGRYQTIVQNAYCTDTSGLLSVRMPCISIGPNIEKSDLNTQEPESVCTVYLDNFQNQLVVDIKTDFVQLITISCYDQLGRLVISDQHLLEPGANTIIKDVAKFENGVYLIKIWTNNNEILAKKFVKL
ncbi:MAG TPA: T9SS type A sorting domain-containing protein [Bacteroidia bacterium]|nr:T9SS type A sorting domain-containing protein [Bacteroidia bacterium]